MPHLVHVHWLWLFGALSLGIIAGWLTRLSAAAQWNGRRTHIVGGVVLVGILWAIAKVVPARYGHGIEIGLVLAVVATIGCLIGWALCDLADFMPPATRPGTMASAVAAGSYVYRDAFAGMGVSPAYMRATMGQGGPERVRLPPHADDPTRAPAPGGYTFPKTLPFADATSMRRSGAASDVRTSPNDVSQE